MATAKTLKLQREAALAIHEAENVLTKAGLPSYMELVFSLAGALMVLDGRKSNKAAAIKRGETALEALRPGAGLSYWK